MALTETRSSYQAAFALDVTTAAIALVFLILATGPTFRRIKARRFSVPGKDRPAPLKTSLGTYLFLWPALFLFTVIYILTFVVDLLKATGTIEYGGGLTLQGDRGGSDGKHQYSSSILSLIITFLSILFTVLLNGSVWIYSNHTCANGTGRAAPSFKSRVQNTVEMLAILATGMAMFGYGATVRARTSSWATTVSDDRITRILYILYRVVVVAATLSVSIEVLRRYFQIKANSSKSVSPLRIPRDLLVISRPR